MALLLIAIISTGVMFAQTITPKQNDKGKWGIVDNTGKWVEKAEYSAIEPYGNGFYRMQKDGKWGVYSFKKYKDKVLDCKYSTIYKGGYGEKTQFIAQEKDKPEKWVIVTNEKRAEYYSDQWKKKDLKNVSIKDLGNGVTLLTGTADKPAGFLMKGSVCISPVIAASQITGNFYLCSSSSLSYSADVYDISTGECIAQNVTNLVNNDSLLILKHGSSNSGDIDRYSTVITADGRLCSVTEGMTPWVFLTASDGKKGLYNNFDDKLIFSPDYDDIISSKERADYFFISRNGMWGIFSKNENINTGLIYPAKECPFEIFGYNGPILVASDGKAGLLDIKGNELVKCEYDKITKGDRNDIFTLEKDGKSYIYNKNDKSLSERKYSGYKRFIGAKNFFRVEQNGKFGVVDDKDNLVVPIKYSKITEAITSDHGHLDDAFHVWDVNSHIGVVKVINGKGKEIVPCGKYNPIWGYESYGIIVIKDGKQGCIKEDGTIFCQPIYDGHINGMKRIGFVKNSATSNDVTVDIYDYNGKYLTTVNVGSDYLDIRWFVQKYLM